MQPINMIKNYYGEKHAFEFTFLCHYQCWLVVPSVVGLIASIDVALNFAKGYGLK